MIGYDDGHPTPILAPLPPEEIGIKKQSHPVNLGVASLYRYGPGKTRTSDLTLIRTPMTFGEVQWARVFLGLRRLSFGGIRLASVGFGTDFGTGRGAAPKFRIPEAGRYRP